MNPNWKRQLDALVRHVGKLERVVEIVGNIMMTLKEELQLGSPSGSTAPDISQLWSSMDQRKRAELARGDLGISLLHVHWQSNGARAIVLLDEEKLDLPRMLVHLLLALAAQGASDAGRLVGFKSRRQLLQKLNLPDTTLRDEHRVTQLISRLRQAIGAALIHTNKQEKTYRLAMLEKGEIVVSYARECAGEIAPSRAVD